MFWNYHKLTLIKTLKPENYVKRELKKRTAVVRLNLTPNFPLQNLRQPSSSAIIPLSLHFLPENKKYYQDEIVFGVDVPTINVNAHPHI